MKIRKLVESDYEQVIDLYTQLDEFHVQARPDCFVHREKDKIYPKDAFVHNLAYPGGLDLGAFDGDLLPFNGYGGNLYSYTRHHTFG